MFTDIPSSWKNNLFDEFQKPYFLELETNLEKEYANGTCFPPKDLIFAAFKACLLDDLKVVILGQDPYHGKGEANGLCFSVNDGVKIPPSLRNIFQEINSDLDKIFLPETGNLERWAKQGIASTHLLPKSQASLKKLTRKNHLSLLAIA